MIKGLNMALWRTTDYVPRFPRTVPTPSTEKDPQTFDEWGAGLRRGLKLMVEEQA